MVCFTYSRSFISQCWLISFELSTLQSKCLNPRNYYFSCFLFYFVNACELYFMTFVYDNYRNFDYKFATPPSPLIFKRKSDPHSFLSFFLFQFFFCFVQISFFQLSIFIYSFLWISLKIISFSHWLSTYFSNFCLFSLFLIFFLDKLTDNLKENFDQ